MVQQINMLVRIRTSKVGSQTLSGYSVSLQYGEYRKDKTYLADSNSKDVRIEGLAEAFSMIKDNSVPINLRTNFIENLDDLVALTSLKKASKISNILNEFDIISVTGDEVVDDALLQLMTDKENELQELQAKQEEADKLKDLIVLEKVGRAETPTLTTVEVDEFTEITKQCFDFEFTGVSEFRPYKKPTNIPQDFSIGVIVGASGTGKSTLLGQFGQEEDIDWNSSKAIISHFETPQDGIDKLTAVGLNSIPSWVRPYHVLSTGEKFRADLARRIKDNAVIDEFTSVVDRNVAKATSTSISKYIKKNGIKGVVISTCHEDIIDWLEPCWVFDTNSGTLYDGGSLRRPTIELEIHETKDYDLWQVFKDHHYLSEDLNKASRKFIATWNGQIVGFSATLPIPSGTIKNGYRGHRTVILPDFQGLGLGVRFSDAIGQIHIDEGKRYYSKTSHIRMGEYRQNSPLWKPTSKNRKQRKDMTHVMGGNSWKVDQNKISYSHEYIGG